jgi:hypothetical protein
MRNPFAKQRGFSFGPLDYSDDKIAIVIGDNVFTNVVNPIVVSGIPMISMLEPESDGAPIRLSAIMAGYDGSPMLSIVENEWRASTGRWDVNTVADRVTIRNGARQVGIKFRHKPREAIHFESGRIAFAGLRIAFGEREPTTIGMMGQEPTSFSGCVFSYSGTGIYYSLPPELIASANAWVRTQGAIFSIDKLR